MCARINPDKLQNFVWLSRTAGARADFVQGGGGNTSMKLDGETMVIKASGYCLKDITPENAYAVLNYRKIRKFYQSHETSDFEDVEKAGSACVKENKISVEGLPDLRPSVEAGFHSLLKTYVLHSHSVYANLACCARECREIGEKAFADASYSWGMVPYTDPGASLTFAIRDEMKRVEEKTGKVPSVILMQNHGVIVHDDDPDRCLIIHLDANIRLAACFGVKTDDFPAVSVEETEPGLYEARVPYLNEMLKSGRYPEKLLLEEPLYPDQMVFLTGTYSESEKLPEEGCCTADPATGTVRCRMDQKKAQVMVETLTAVTFIMEHIRSAGYSLSTMGQAAKHFIANWESEKYRKSLSGKK